MPFTQLRPVALLSFFDGIGVAAQALKSLCVEPALYFSFETDVACQRCCTSQHSSVEHQGDALAVDPSRLASTLKTRCSPDTVLLVCAAPPCHDFSAIRGASSPGVAGPEGAKFVSWSKWLQQFASVCTLQLVLVVENVLMQPDIQDLFDKELCCKSFVCDALLGRWFRGRASGGLATCPHQRPTSPHLRQCAVDLHAGASTTGFGNYSRPVQCSQSKSRLPVRRQCFTTRSSRAEFCFRVSRHQPLVRPAVRLLPSDVAVSRLARWLVGKRGRNNTPLGNTARLLLSGLLESIARQTRRLANGFTVCLRGIPQCAPNRNVVRNSGTPGTCPWLAFSCAWC